MNKDLTIQNHEFELVQRRAKLYSASNLVPQDFQGQNGMANAIVALEMASRMNMNPLMVMQNMYIVHGKPSWSSQFIIACINTSGRFTPLKFKYSDDDTSCVAYATDKESGEVCESIEITLQMATSEGWTKSGKWKNIPKLMLQYRAASFFGRAYCPDLLMGLYSEHETKEIHNQNKEMNKPTVTIEQLMDDEEYQENNNTQEVQQ